MVAAALQQYSFIISLSSAFSCLVLCKQSKEGMEWVVGRLNEAIVKVLVLMHSKEYLNPGTDAKLLLAMLLPERAKLYARLPPSNPARGARARCGAVHAPVPC